MTILLDLIRKRDELRKQWRLETDPNKKAIIVLRGRCLNIAIRNRDKDLNVYEQEKLIRDIF